VIYFWSRVKKSVKLLKMSFLTLRYCRLTFSMSSQTNVLSRQNLREKCPCCRLHVSTLKNPDTVTRKTEYFLSMLYYGSKKASTIYSYKKTAPQWLLTVKSYSISSRVVTCFEIDNIKTDVFDDDLEGVGGWVDVGVSGWI